MTRRLFLMAAFLFTLGGGLVADDKTEMKTLEGTWQVADAEFDGKKIGESLKGLELVLKGDTYSVTIGKEKDIGTYKLDVSKSPKQMDISGGEGPNRGKTYPCIYEIKDEWLTVCYGMDFKTRPTDLKTAEKSNRMLILYKKKK